MAENNPLGWVNQVDFMPWEILTMTKVSEIKEAIESLSDEDFIRLREWMEKKDWDEWDREIEADSEAGKLDFLIEEAREEKAKGKLRDL